MAAAPDPARQAGDAALDRLVPAGDGGPEVTQVIRDGASLVLRRGPVLVRVRASADAEVAHREVQLATALLASGVPTTDLVDPADQPWAVGAHVVTAWRWSEGGPPVTDADLGALARILREHTVGAAATVPVFDPIEAILHAVAGRPDDDPEVAFVRGRAGELAAAWADGAAEDPLGRAVVHGDLHRANVVPGPGGPLLTDLELSGSGPPSYDAAPAVVAVDRYGADPATLEAFLTAFGADPRGWTGFATFVAVYELWVTAWAVGVRDQDPTWAAEASRRVGTLRDGADRRWTLS